MTLAAPAPAPVPRSATASAPGKLILAGEHAVVYGRPALVAALDLRLRVRVEKRTDRTVTIELPAAEPEAARPDAPPPQAGAPDGAPPDAAPPAGRRAAGVTGAGRTETTWPEIAAYTRRAREAWQRWHDAPEATAFRDVCGGGFEHVVLVALGEAAAFLGEPGDGPGLHLSVTTELPVGRGFGSSAATAAGTVAAYLRLRGAEASTADLLRLAVEVERRQHGLPSGVDPATVLQGGVLWAERQPAGSAGALRVTPIAGRSPLLSRLAVYDTGQPPESTGEVVAAVRELRRGDPARVESACEAIAAATGELRDLVADRSAPPAAAVPVLRRVQRALESLGVVPEPVRRLVRRVEAAGGAAKISGAGSLAGPGAGCVIALHDDAACLDAALAGAARRLPVTLGGVGLEVSAP